MAKLIPAIEFNDPLDQIDALFVAANSIPEGAPVGTVKQRPDGTFVAVRCGDVSPYPASWVYVRVMPGACEEPYGDDADSWPSYGEITPEPEGCGIGLDGECEGKCRKGDAPVGTIARRPDGIFLAVRKAESSGAMYWQYWAPGGARIADGMPLPSDADSWPVIYDPREHEGTEYDPETGLHWFKPGEEPLVPRPDPTAQQEPAYTVAAASEEMAKHWDNSIVTTTKREPRVVDRLGVDERGSRWHGAEGAAAYFHDGQSWRTNQGRVFPAGYQPDWNAPYTEILEPRVLPSLDCEEARDGTVWQAAFSQTDHGRGWKFWYVPAEREWYTDVGYDGSGALRVLEFLTERGPYTEVLGDPL